MDPATYRAATAAAIRICGLVAAEIATAGLPVDEALAEVEKHLAGHPDHGGLQALQLVFQSLGELEAMGRLLTEGIPFQVVEVAEPAKGPAVAVPGGLGG